jgi:hypothetical protein
MNKNNATVTLANGRQVIWDEFSMWTAHKQRMGLDPHAKKMSWGVSHSETMRQIVKESYENGTRKTNWNYGSKNGMSKAVMTPEGEFSSLKEAINHYKVSAEKMRTWIYKTRSTEFYLLSRTTGSDRGILSSRAKAVMTPDGKFDSINATARHYGVGCRTIKTWIRSMRKDEFSYSE